MAFHPSLSGFIDAASSRLGDLISQNVGWRPRDGENRDPEAQWWSCALTVDADCRFYAGAGIDTWDELRHGSDSGFAVLLEAIERVATERFGADVRCTDIESCEMPPEDWAASVWQTAAGPIEVVMSPAVVDALGGEPEVPVAAHAANSSPAGSMDMLMHVEIPVSVSLGKTRLRVKELVGLNHGSVVELDQELGDRVEIRVNNCVIAHGEVVAVDGNYGVRILSMVSNGQARRGLFSRDSV